MKEKYEEKRRSRAWISILILIPGIVILVGVAIYWIMSIFF
jgi:flagellar basal body-associated protein FliL